MVTTQKRFLLSTFPLEYKTVFLRVDYNVPLDNKKNPKVLDNTKIKESLPTILFLLQKKCKIILATHIGRPEGKVVETLRVAPVVKELRRLLHRYQKYTVLAAPDSIGKEVVTKIAKMKPESILFLENLRFYQQEEDNDPAFAHTLADFAEVYVNDAFGTSHRAHASVEAITHFLPSMAGFLLEKEIYYLGKALNPAHPAVWVMGGAKLSKVELMKKAMLKADYILVGGALAFAFLKVQGKSVGMSKIDATALQTAKELLKNKNASKLLFPVDFAIASSMDLRATRSVVESNKIPPLAFALDIGPRTIELYTSYLHKARTVVWNGPLGYFESTRFAQGTRDIARVMSTLSATTICGGGETEEAIRKFRLEHTMTHVSTGGGACLEFLEGKKLPALEALLQNYITFKSRFNMHIKK
ncbi:phosphoglycerate kinase [Candidatus Woesearchaeota archaeon]|nr:phosphoglycerate kinase [Candidatus Woesearchaeota archaeon]